MSKNEEANTDGFGEWVILELMGHRKLAGFLSEQEIAGNGFLRLDIHGAQDEPVVTQFYSPSAVYCITPVSDDLARKAAYNLKPQPIGQYELVEYNYSGANYD